MLLLSSQMLSTWPVRGLSKATLELLGPYSEPPFIAGATFNTHCENRQVSYRLMEISIDVRVIIYQDVISF